MSAMDFLFPLLLHLLRLYASEGLVFQSHAVKRQWDTWAFVENGTYYVYYLVTEESPGEGFGVAISPNGQQWIDQGYVFHGPSWTRHHWWEGTGSVWRAPDYEQTGRYLINWSQDPGQYQNITFGESYDLIHWTPIQKWFNIDERYYEFPGRWDCIYTLPVFSARQPASGSTDGYPRYGFWTATPKAGAMGFGITEDGVAWKALPSPEMVPAIQGEVGAVEYIEYGNGRSGYYALLGNYGDMIVYNASNIQGPYYVAKKNAFVLAGLKSCYFARFFYSANRELLVTHQTFWHNHQTYVSPFKRAVVDHDGTLRLSWWKENDNLKGVRLPHFDVLQHSLASVDPSRGALIEARFQLARGPQKDLAQLPGFVLETVDGGGVIVVVDMYIKVTLALVSNATAPLNAHPIATIDRELHNIGLEFVDVRLLYRRDMIEVYVNDFLFPVYLMSPSSGRIGVLPHSAASQVYGYTMRLPGNRSAKLDSDSFLI